MTVLRIPFARSPQQVGLSSDPIEASPGESQPAGFTPEQVQQLFGGLAMAISELEDNQRQSIEELQLVAVELSSAAASWLSMATIDRGMFRIDRLIADAIAQLHAPGPVTVRLNPLDLELLEDLRKTHADDSADFSNVDFVGDPGMARGGCKATSAGISLVSDLETRLAGVRQAWLENLDDAQTERRAAGDDRWQPGRVPDRRETA